MAYDTPITSAGKHPLGVKDIAQYHGKDLSMIYDEIKSEVSTKKEDNTAYVDYLIVALPKALEEPKQGLVQKLLIDAVSEYHPTLQEDRSKKLYGAIQQGITYAQSDATSKEFKEETSLALSKQAQKLNNENHSSFSIPVESWNTSIQKYLIG